MAQISAILFSRHSHLAITFCCTAIATCATFFSSRQWLGGAKSGASSQHCVIDTGTSLAKTTIRFRRPVGKMYQKLIEKYI